MSDAWAFVYPGLSVVFLGAGLRAWGRYARRGGWGSFWLGVALVALGIDGLRELGALLAFRDRTKRLLIWGLVVLSVGSALWKTWRSLGPQPLAEPQT
ncbi:MAG: hypothetical protein R3F62_28300 [Planctomycetota bacterium]